MQGHDLLAKAEADTGTSGFGSEKRNKYFVDGFGYDSHSIVTNTDDSFIRVFDS